MLIESLEQRTHFSHTVAPEIVKDRSEIAQQIQVNTNAQRNYETLKSATSKSWDVYLNADRLKYKLDTGDAEAQLLDRQLLIYHTKQRAAS